MFSHCPEGYVPVCMVTILCGVIAVVSFMCGVAYALHLGQSNHPWLEVTKAYWTLYFSRRADALMLQRTLHSLGIPLTLVYEQEFSAISYVVASGLTALSAYMAAFLGTCLIQNLPYVNLQSLSQ